MTDKRRKIPPQIDETDFLNVTSANECTGLVQTVAEDDAEAESYADILPSAAKDTNRKDKQKKKLV